jgi:very-short-patch-repair endonuclease
MSLKYNGKNIKLAKGLRKNATPQENRLWYEYLSKYKVRFQRQKAIGSFIADFYCYKAKLIIEIDGSQHYTEAGRRKDDFRTEKLEEFNLNVIRFTNQQIDENLSAVCSYIDRVVQASLTEGGGPPKVVEGVLGTNDFRNR